MADDKGSTPFYEHPRFKGTVAVIGLVSAVFALVGVPKLIDVIGDAISTDKAVALSNTAVILDTSAAMGQPFEAGDTRFDAALKAMGQAVPGNKEGLALRRTGPECGGEEEEPLVDFGTGNRQAVLGEAEAQRPGGKSNIVKAVIEAVEEFRSNPKFNRPDSTRRILVFTAGRDDCFSGNVADKLSAELKDDRISASFALIALNASGQGLIQLRELKSALKSAGADPEIYTPDDQDELNENAEEVKASAPNPPSEKEEEEGEEGGGSGTT